MIETEDFEGDDLCIVVPDKAIEAMIAQMESEGEYNSSFHRVKTVSHQYVAANLTPIIVYDLNSSSLYCIVKELYGKKLN